MNITGKTSFADLQSLIADVKNPEINHRLYVQDTGAITLKPEPFDLDDFTGKTLFRVETITPSYLGADAAKDSNWMIPLHAALQKNFHAGFRGVLLEY